MPTPEPRFDPSRRLRAPGVIFWTAFALRLLCILVGHTYRIRPGDAHFDFGFEAGRIARALVSGYGYANPFNGVSGPTAWLPPLYPLLMALAFKLFGVYTRSAAFFLLAVNSLFSALIVPAVYEIAARCVDSYGLLRRRSTHPMPVAQWTAWLWAVYPAALQYAIHWIWEMSLSTMLFTWTLVLALRLRGIGEGGEARLTASGATHEPLPKTAAANLRLWLAFGLLWGSVASANASLVLMFPVTILWVLWPALRTWSGIRMNAHLFAGAALACVLFALVLTPWTVRNARVLHVFAPTRDNFGIELWQSTQFAENGPLPWGTSLPLAVHAPEFQRYVAEGEVRYAREKGELAKRNIRAHPGIFLRYTLERVQFFWFGTPHPENGHPLSETLRVLNFSFTSLAGLLGLGLMLRRGVPGAGLFLLALAVLPAVYYALTVQPRFRHPLEPLLTLGAVYLFRSTSYSGQTEVPSV